MADSFLGYGAKVLGHACQQIITRSDEKKGSSSYIFKITLIDNLATIAVLLFSEAVMLCNVPVEKSDDATD